MADQSLEQHQSDVDEKLGHVQSGSAYGTGGACLNRHIGDTPEEGEKNSCSHRWQAYLRMKDDHKLYDWDKYESLLKRKRIRTAATKAGKSIIPDWYNTYLEPPKEGAWDVKGNNFKVKCYTPYWHEAHHIVPNSTLRNAIIDFQRTVEKGEELVKKVRGGLLKEKYNLNCKINMIMLPMDKEVADAIGLPRHRKRRKDFHHATYSKHVSSELKKIFKVLKQNFVEHKTPKYNNLKDKIENLSKHLYDQITKAGGDSLDDMEETKFKVPLPAAKALG